MKYDKNIVIANAIAAAMLAFSLLRLFMWTGNVHWNVVCGFAPMALAFIALRPGAGRAIGGVAILLNGLLVFVGVLGLAFSMMSLDKGTVYNNMLGLVFCAALLLTGVLNVRAIWNSFPPKRQSEQ